MKKSILFYMMAAMLIFATACSKDDDDNDNNDGSGTSGHSFTGINKVVLTINGNAQEFVFADESYNTSDTDASMCVGTKHPEYDSVYTEISMASVGLFEHVSTGGMVISYFGAGTGTQDISYELEDAIELDDFSGSVFFLLTDTSAMPIMYNLDIATANITSYGDVGGFIEGTFESSQVSDFNGNPAPNVSISGNFKALRFEDGV